jgi:hypothetical protein
MKKKVIKHLEGDIKTFKKEASEDRGLIKELDSKTWQSSEPTKVRMPMKTRRPKLDVSEDRVERLKGLKNKRTGPARKPFKKGKPIKVNKIR